MKKEAVIPKKGGKAVGPYSPGVIFGNLIFVSGQIGKDPKTDDLATGIKLQTERAFESLKIVLEAGNSDINNVLKTTVYLADMNDYTVMNDIYATYFQKPYPARATVQVAKLPKGALVEIECIAYIKNEEENCCGGDCGCC